MATAKGSRRNAARLSEARSGNLRQLLIRATRTLNVLVLQGLAKRGHGGIRLTHSSLLANIDLAGSRISDVAERAEMSKQAAGTLADELETMGYITRRVDQGDARGRLLIFTDKGRHLMIDILEIVEDIEKWYAANLGDQTVSALRTGLAAVVGIRRIS